MRDLVTSSVPVPSAMEWHPRAPIAKPIDERRLTVVAFVNRLAAGTALKIVSDAFAEATGLPPRLRRLGTTAANDNARGGVIELDHYRLGRPQTSFLGGRHGRNR